MFAEQFLLPIGESILDHTINSYRFHTQTQTQQIVHIRKHHKQYAAECGGGDRLRLGSHEREREQRHKQPGARQSSRSKRGEAKYSTVFKTE